VNNRDLYIGFNALSHHSSAAIVEGGGEVLGAVEEERFSHLKREGRWPIESIRYCLRAAGAATTDLAGVAFGWSPGSFFVDRIVRSQLFEYPVASSIVGKSFRRLWSMAHQRDEFQRRVGYLCSACRFLNIRHHMAHAASAYFSSPFDCSAFITWDGRGEADAMTWGMAYASRIRQFGAVRFPNSIGKLYSAMCRYLGFAGAEKDGTVMALAACGEARFRREFGKLFRWDFSGAAPWVQLGTSYFDLADVALPSAEMAKLFDLPSRRADEPLLDVHRDIAATLQLVTQTFMVDFASFVRRRTRSERLVMAGGVALNTVANGLIAERCGYRDLFIQPAAHDGGLALGTALYLAAMGRREKSRWTMRSAAIGPQYDERAIERAIHGVESVVVTRPPCVAKAAASRMARGEIIGWFQGRLEFGPRALGHRSLLADPRIATIKGELNKLKQREPFRPFGISILAEHAPKWLKHGKPSPHMLIVDHFKENLRHQFPSALHVDGSVRVQTVVITDEPEFHQLISSFAAQTGVPIVINTSLNEKGKPLACTPADAMAYFLGARGLHSLYIGPFEVVKRE
jgi:carbamoyltransferase